MCRDSGVSGRRPTSGVVSSSETIFGNRRALDSRTTNPPHGHSSTSFLDPIATSEDEEELVISLLIPNSPESPHEHASFKPEARTSTSEIMSADDVDNFKPNPSCSIRIPSPPERSTNMLSRSRDLGPSRVSSKYSERLEDITNGEVSEPLATHITNVVFPRPTRPTEAVPDSIPDGPRCGTEPPEDLTTQDIDTLLDAVPVPFDFSLAHHHLASRENGENDGQSEENPLWWHHPIFEERAKADIRRTLSALLPSDPSQDPSPVEMGGWRAEVRPRRFGAQIWAERLEDAFGPGPLNRGLGRKPCRVVGEYPSIPQSVGFAVKDHDVIQEEGLADGVRIRPVPCDSCARRGRGCIGKNGRACLPCKEHRVACSHVAKPRKDITVGSPESDPQVHSTNRRLHQPRPDVRPSDLSSGSAGPTSHAKSSALKSRGSGIQAPSVPDGERVRVDWIGDGEGDSFRCDEDEITEAASAAWKPTGWERGVEVENYPSGLSAEDCGRILDQIRALEEKASDIVGEISALKTFLFH